jgi:ABC-type phosphate transport system permease subunit
MSTSQRVSRGFHRLGLFLAAIPLLAVFWLSAYFLFTAWEANAMNGVSWHDFWAGTTLYQTLWVTVGPAAIALPVALAVYMVVRAIGWIIGGFAAS